MFTREVTALRDNCVLTPDHTTVVCKPHTAASPLFTAAAVRIFPSANAHTHFLYITTMSEAAMLNKLLQIKQINGLL